VSCNTLNITKIFNHLKNVPLITKLYYSSTVLVKHLALTFTV